MLERIEKYNEMNNNELRTFLIEKSDELDNMTDRLHKMYGLDLPQNDFEILTNLKEDVKALKFLVVRRFKAGKIN